VVHSVDVQIDIPKNEVHEIGVSQYTLSVYCGRYIRITTEKRI